MERWAEYVEELYKDENRRVDDIIDMSQMENEVYTVWIEEIEALWSEIWQEDGPAVVTTFLQSYYSAWGRKLYR